MYLQHSICVKWRSIMHLTYICQFLCVYTPPHLSSPSQIPINTPILTAASHTTKSCEYSNQPKASSSSTQALLRDKGSPWFPPCSHHFAHLSPKSLHRLDIVGIRHYSILNPFHFMMSRQDTPHLPTSIHNPGLTTTQPYQPHSSSNIRLIHQSQNSNCVRNNM